MSRAIVSRERLLGLENAIHDMDQTIVALDILFDHKPSHGETRESLCPLCRAPKE